MSIIPFSRFNRPKTIPASFGSGMEPVFEEKLVDGRLSLVKVGENPISPMIQEFKADTLVYNILARYQRGDINALNVREGQFMDVVGMPTTLAEAQQKLIDVTRQFDQMPLALRQKFNNNVNEYIEAVSNGSVKDVISLFAPEQDIVPDIPSSDSVPASDVKE